MIKDSFVAEYMTKKFGVEFTIHVGELDKETFVPTVESLNTFKPKLNDLGVDAAGRQCKFVLNDWICWGKSSSPVYPVRINEREGKPFFPYR